MRRTRATWTGSTLRSRSRDEKAAAIAEVNQTLVPRWTTGEISVPVDATFSLEDVALAYDHFGHSGKFGKVVLRVDQ